MEEVEMKKRRMRKYEIKTIVRRRAKATKENYKHTTKQRPNTQK